MELVDRIKPGGIRIYIESFIGLVVEHVERLSQVRAEPDELMTDIGGHMISMRSDWFTCVVVHDHHSRGSLKWQGRNEIHQKWELVGGLVPLPQIGIVKILIAVVPFVAAQGNYSRPRLPGTVGL